MRQFPDSCKKILWRQATSEGEPAQATVTAGAHSAGGSPTAELEMQSHPSPFAPQQHSFPHPAAVMFNSSGACSQCLPCLWFEQLLVLASRMQSIKQARLPASEDVHFDRC